MPLGKTYVKSILNSKSYHANGEAEYEARRFTHIPISVSLKYQNAKGCHMLSAMDKGDNSLKVGGNMHRLYRKLAEIFPNKS